MSSSKIEHLYDSRSWSHHIFLGKPPGNGFGRPEENPTNTENLKTTLQDFGKTQTNFFFLGKKTLGKHQKTLRNTWNKTENLRNPWKNLENPLEKLKKTWKNARKNIENTGKP